MSRRIVTSDLDRQFRALTTRPSQRVLADPRNFSGDIPPHLVKAMTRAAQVGTPSVDRVGQFRYNPFIQTTNLDIPSDLRIRHQYMRYFVKTNALVGAAIELHCIPDGEPVLVRSGVKPIEEVKKGEEVLARDGTWQRVLEADSHEFEGEMYCLKVNGLPPFRCTDEHPVLVRGWGIEKTARRNTKGKLVHDSERRVPLGDPVWKQAKELEVGDYVLIPKHRPTSASEEKIDLAPYIKYGPGVGYRIDGESLICRDMRRRRFLTPNKDLASLLGWYVAEGSSGMDFSLNVDEVEEAQEIVRMLKLCADVDALTPLDRTSKEGFRCKLVHFSYGPFGRWLLDACGDGAHTKQVPEFVMNCRDLEIIRAFILAYYSGDGCDREYDKHAITVSRTLAYQMQMLLGRFGVAADLKVRPHPRTGGLQYVLIVTLRDWTTKILGETDPFKKQHFKLTHQDENYFYAPIRKITHQAERCTVHDIHTEDHSFAVPFLVHNSEFPLSGFHIRHEDPAIEEFLEDMIEETDLVEHVFQAAMEWWTIGEFFSFGFLDDVDSPASWTGFTLLDPDKILIQTSPWVQGNRAKKEHISLVIDNLTQKIVEQGLNHPLTGAVCRQLPQDIVQACQSRRPLMMSPLQVTHVKRGSPFSVRGESIIERVFPLLMYRDKLRQAQYTVVDRHIVPTELWKVGETGDPADEEELNSFRDLIAGTWNDLNRCFHPSHECLTRDGWKTYTELLPTDEVGTINVTTGALEYQIPTKIHVYDFNGEMIHFDRDPNDILVTPNHRMLLENHQIVQYVGDPTVKGGQFNPAPYEQRDRWGFVEARNVNQDRSLIPYVGKVWCVSVPNETIITRRNGRICVTGNSIITHHAVQYQVEGANGKILPIWQEMEGVDTEILAGLLLNKSLIMGESGTFASDIVRYDILVNRYLIFRKKIEKWLLRSVFAPILRLHEMYVPEYRVKSMQYRKLANKGRPLAFPTIKWEKQNLRDDQNRVQMLIELAAKGLVPYDDIYPLIDLDPRQVRDKIDDELLDRAERMAKTMKKLKDRGLPLPPELTGGEGGGPPGSLPSAMGGPGDMGLPSGPGGLDGADMQGDSEIGGPTGGIPSAIPGANAENPTGGMANSLPGQPKSSQLPMGVPTS